MSAEPLQIAARASESASYLTVFQVADLLQVDPKTITRWSRQDPSMPVLRRGRVLRFPRVPLLAWLERQQPRASRKDHSKAS